MKPTLVSPLISVIKDLRGEYDKLPPGIRRNQVLAIIDKLELHQRHDEQYRFELYREGFADGMQLIRQKLADNGKANDLPETESLIGRYKTIVQGDEG